MGESPFLYLQGTTPAFEYPRSDLPSHVHFIGPFLPERPASFTAPEWWPDLQGNRPVVLVTQGTVTTDADHLIAPTLKALAGQDVLVIATTGTKTNTAAKLLDVPANARVESFLSYHHLMPYVDVMVTNGGYGSVQLALSYGIPLVAGGSTEDKPEICARIAWAGVGVNLRTQTPKPEQVRAAVQRVLADPRFKHRAQQIKASFAQHNAANEAVLLLEQLAQTKQPGLRSIASPLPVIAPALRS
jgi:MGT family glycosyltransferase